MCATASGGGQAHWDTAYRDRGAAGVSWFQPTPSVSLELIHRVGVPSDAAVIDVGGGASTLIDALAGEGFGDLTVLDISAEALGIIRDRLPLGSAVALVQGDVLAWAPERTFDLWHDRAVLHFLVDEGTRRRYFDRVRKALRPNGHIIVGAFAADGPPSCSGLPVVRYSPEALSALLGDDFDVVTQTREEHVTPTGGVQPFTWIAARRRG